MQTELAYFQCTIAQHLIGLIKTPACLEEFFKFHHPEMEVLVLVYHVILHPV